MSDTQSTFLEPASQCINATVRPDLPALPPCCRGSVRPDKHVGGRIDRVKATTGTRRRVLLMESYPHVVYGQQREMLAMLPRLPQQQVDPLVGVTANGPFVDEVHRLGVTTTLFEYPPLLGSYGGAIYRYRGLRRAAFAGQLVSYVRQVRRRLCELQITGVFCNDLRGLLTVGLAARSLRIPVMIWDKLDRPHGLLDWLELPLANVTAFISEAVKTKFPRWQLRAYRKRLQTIHDGVDIAAMDAARGKRRELGLADDDLVLAVVGTITRRKGQDRLLAILPRLVEEIPQARVLIVGGPSGSQEDRCYFESLPHRDHPRVKLLGMRHDVPEIMQSIDVLVAPSRQEGLGLVLLEAMACRKPVVAARTGGMREVVTHAEDGFLFDGDNQEELLFTLSELCRSAELRSEMGQAGRRRVERSFDRDVQMDKVVECFVQMVGAEEMKLKR